MSAYVIDGPNLNDQGVRIGPIDLFRTKLRRLIKMGVDSSVIQKMTPYIGLVDSKAIDLLKTIPLQLSQAEMDALVQKFTEYSKLKFSKLPKFIQDNPKVRLFTRFNDHIEFMSIKINL